jgi:RNA-directed DNA polymerase
MKDRTPRPTSRQGIATKAERHKGYRVRHLDGRLDEDFRKQGWRDLRQEAASGVEQVRAQAYEPHLDEHLHRLVERLKQKRSRAKLVRRHDMPKGEGPQRPRGIPAVEDKRLQLAVARRRDAIDAQDFRRGREGSRPPVGALDAVETRTITRQCGRDAWVVEADIKTFCDPIAHAWLGRM